MGSNTSVFTIYSTYSYVLKTCYEDHIVHLTFRHKSAKSFGLGFFHGSSQYVCCPDIEAISIFVSYSPNCSNFLILCCGRDQDMGSKEGSVTYKHINCQALLYICIHNYICIYIHLCAYILTYKYLCI